MKPNRSSVLVAAVSVAVASMLQFPIRAATVLTDAADWAFTSFLVTPNSTTRAWSFGNSAANAPTVVLNGVTVLGNLGVNDPATGLTFTTTPSTYAISGFNWQAGTDQLQARNDLSKGGLHGGVGTFAMNLGGVPGDTYLIEILSLQSGGVRSMDVIVDGVLVQDEWQVPGASPYNRVLKIETVCDADGVDLLFGRGSTGDQNPAIVALAITQTSPEVAPNIFVHPQGFTNYVGEYSVAGGLAVWAGGTGTLSYQWQKGEEDIAGATNRVLAFADPLILTDAGDYRVIVGHSLNGLTSAVATVVILPVTTVTEALAGYWTFDETSGATAADSGPNANPGALINFPTDDSQWVSGQVGGALRFGGVSPTNYVYVTNYPKPSVTLTISAWVWAEVRGSWATIVKNWPGANGQFHLGLDAGTGDLSNYLRQQGGTQVGPVREGAATPFPTNSWQHVAVVADGKVMRLYRNGLLVGTPISYNGTINTNPVNDSLSIGAKWQSFAVVDSFWQGNMDDLGLWTRALRPDEILSIYRAGTNGLPLTAASLDNPPEVAVQPVGATRYVGEFTRALAAQVVGTPPLTWQWRKDGEDVPGATGATLAFPDALTAADAGSYTLFVANAYGNVTTEPAVLTVVEPAAIVDGLAGYWNFDEGAGSLLVDYSGNGNDGALLNFPTDDSQWVPGRVGGALHFRGPGVGLNDYVLVANYPKPDAAMTITAWVWADSRPQWATIIKNWQTEPTAQFHFGLEATAGDLSNYLIQQGGARVGPVREGSAAPLGLGVWHHVALVCNGKEMRLYRNGELVGTPLAYNGSINTNVAAPLAIGAKLGAGGVPPTTADSGYWHGTMDDLGLWARALSAEEILAIQVAGLNGLPLSEAIVGALPPAIGTPPRSLTVTEGEDATFSVEAGGTPPLHYQWRKDGQDIPGAIGASLVLSDLCAGEGGEVDVVVRNASGTVTSASATLTILPLTAGVPITAGLAGHWTFDDGTGAVAMDSTANANHGLLTNFPTDDSQWVPGQVGGALAFRGPAGRDYVVVPDYPKPSLTLTISAWVWADAYVTWASLVKNWATEPGGEIHFGLNGADGDLSNYLIQQNGVFVGPVREGTAMPLGSWQHVALVCDGFTQRLYRNGAPVGSPLPYDGTINTNLTLSMLAFGAKLASGGVPPDGEDSGYWQGKMDDIGLWLRGLSSREIAALYNAGLGGRDLATASVLPILAILRSGSDLVISWPAAPAGRCYSLESAETLPAAGWTPVNLPWSLENGRYSVTVPDPGVTRFYRLRK